jgi:hypothetical protein
MFETGLNAQLHRNEKKRELNKLNIRVGAKVLRDAVPLYLYRELSFKPAESRCYCRVVPMRLETVEQKGHCVTSLPGFQQLAVIGLKCFHILVPVSNILDVSIEVSLDSPHTKSNCGAGLGTRIPMPAYRIVPALATRQQSHRAPSYAPYCRLCQQAASCWT